MKLKLGLILGGVVIVVLLVGFFSLPGQVIPQDVDAKPFPSYTRDIQPIFDQFCLQCHGPEDAHNGLRLDSYQGVIKGTMFGPVVYPGEPTLSNLLVLIKHESAPEIWMPYHASQLSPNRTKNIESWIKYGARNN